MVDNVDPSLYPTYIFRNKLLFPQYLRSENKLPHNILDANVEGDFLLYAYIVQLDDETFSKMPIGLGDLGEVMWVEDKWSQLMPKIVDESRKHGWCVVQFYEDAPRWRVLSKACFTDWIRESDEEGKVIRAGVKFKIVDDLGNSDTEECRFDDGNCFLVKFREGDGQTIFSYSDIPDALLDIVFNARQVKGQMDFIGSKPGFKHYVYGDSADDDSINKLDAQLKYVDLSAGIGAPEGVLKEIRTIEDKHTPVVIDILDKSIELFSGSTRLPVSYYLGQRTSGGLGEKGELSDLVKIDRKKQSLFKRYIPSIKEIFYGLYDITLMDLELEQDVVMNEVVEEKEEKGKDNDNSKEV